MGPGDIDGIGTGTFKTGDMGVAGTDTGAFETDINGDIGPGEVSIGTGAFTTDGSGSIGIGIFETGIG